MKRKVSGASLPSLRQTRLSPTGRLLSISPALIFTVSPCLTELSVPPPGPWLDAGLGGCGSQEPKAPCRG